MDFKIVIKLTAAKSDLPVVEISNFDLSMVILSSPCVENWIFHGY